VDPVNVLAKFAVRSFTVPEILIAIRVLGGELGTPQSWGRRGHRGRGWYRSKERWWVPTGPP